MAVVAFCKVLRRRGRGIGVQDHRQFILFIEQRPIGRTARIRVAVRREITPVREHLFRELLLGWCESRYIRRHCTLEVFEEKLQFAGVRRPIRERDLSPLGLLVLAKFDQAAIN